MERCGTFENVVDCCGKLWNKAWNMIESCGKAKKGCGTFWNRTMERNGRKWKEMEL